MEDCSTGAIAKDYGDEFHFRSHHMTWKQASDNPQTVANNYQTAATVTGNLKDMYIFGSLAVLITC